MAPLVRRISLFFKVHCKVKPRKVVWHSRLRPGITAFAEKRQATQCSWWPQLLITSANDPIENLWGLPPDSPRRSVLIPQWGGGPQSSSQVSVCSSPEGKWEAAWLPDGSFSLGNELRTL